MHWKKISILLEGRTDDDGIFLFIFKVAFLLKNQIWAFVFIAMCQHINAQMISGFLCLVFFLVPLGWHHAFIPRMSTQYRRISTPPARVPKEQTHKSWLLVCVRDCCKRSLEKLKSNKRLRTTLTKNGELFSSTFDLIIYFCVVEFVQIWGAVKAHCQIASSLPFFVFFVSPPLPKYKRTFDTRTNPAPLLPSGAGHVDVFNDVDGGGVDDYCSFVFGLLLFYFNSFFLYIKDSLVQSSLEQRERKKEGEKKAGKTSQSTRSLSKPQAEEVTSFNSFSRCV